MELGPGQYGPEEEKRDDFPEPTPAEMKAERGIYGSARSSKAHYKSKEKREYRAALGKLLGAGDPDHMPQDLPGYESKETKIKDPSGKRLKLHTPFFNVRMATLQQLPLAAMRHLQGQLLQQVWLHITSGFCCHL